MSDLSDMIGTVREDGGFNWPARYATGEIIAERPATTVQLTETQFYCLPSWRGVAPESRHAELLALVTPKASVAKPTTKG